MMKNIYCVYKAKHWDKCMWKKLLIPICEGSAEQIAKTFFTTTSAVYKANKENMLYRKDFRIIKKEDVK